MGYTCRRRWADYVHAMEGKLRYRRRMDVVIRLTRGDDGIAAAGNSGSPARLATRSQGDEQ